MTSDSTRCWLFVSDVQQTWGGASQNCISFGGRLAVEYDNVVHTALMEEVKTYGVAHRWWIGVRRYLFEYWIWPNEIRMGEHVQ